MAMKEELASFRKKNYKSIVSKNDGPVTSDMERIITLIEPEKEIVRDSKEGDEVSLMLKGMVLPEGKIKVIQVGSMSDDEESDELENMSKDVAIRVKPSIQPSPC